VAKRRARGKTGEGNAPSALPSTAMALEAPSSAVLPGAAAYVTPEVFRALVALALTGLVLSALSGLVTALLFALTLALLLAPVVRALEKRRVPRAIGGALAILALGVVLAAFSATFLPRIVRELTELALRIPDGLSRLIAVVEKSTGFALPTNLAELVKTLTERFAGEWKEQVGRVLSSSGSFVGEHAGEVFAGLASVVGTLGQAALVPVIAYFVLVELDALAALALSLAPVVVRRQVLRHGPGIARALSSMVKGQLTVALAMAGIYVVGLLLSGVPLALAIGILAGLAYVIPFASGVVCVGLSVVFVLLEPDLAPLGPIAGTIATAVVVQLVEGWVLTPRIVGEQAGLSPLAVVLAVLCFGELFGFLGVLFALPIAASIAVVVKERAVVVDGRAEVA